VQARIAANLGESKARGRSAQLSLGALALAGALVGGCGEERSEQGSISTRGGTDSGGSVGGGGGAPAAAGNTAVAVTGGSSGAAASAGSGIGASAGATTDGACQSQTFAATRVPLDLYVMLDGSDSMLEPTGNTTKWSAVGSAIRRFVNDAESAGIGLGLQFFPLQDPAAPLVCSTDADCEGFGVCNQRFCQNAGPDFYLCARDSECVADGEDVGPCTPFMHCWSKLVATDTVSLCHDDADCGKVDDCIPFAQCGTNELHLCTVPGAECSSDGTCIAQGPLSRCERWASCDAGTYAAPAVDIAELPAVAPAILSAIAAFQPDGNTPSAPALNGAIEQAHDWVVAKPDHQVAVVLATDGLPSECIADPSGDPGGIRGVAAAAAAGFADTPSVRTFVIGVFAAEETDAPGNLDQIATAGGTEQAFLVTTGSSTDVEQQFLDALDDIRAEGIACELQIPIPESGQPDFARVNVYFTETDTAEVLYYATDAAGCDAGKGDWYYGRDDAGHPTKIIACPATCARFQAATTGKVTIGVGCLTVVR